MNVYEEGREGSTQCISQLVLHNKAPRTAWLFNRNLFSKSFSGDKSEIKAMKDTSPEPPPWCLAGLLNPVSSSSLLSVYAHVLIPSSYKDSSHVGL